MLRPWVVFVALLVAGLVPSAASATVTASSITSAVPLYDVGNFDVPSTDPANARTVSGTSNGTPPDSVRILCRASPISTTGLGTVPVNDDGTWSYTYGARNISGRRCQLAAVPVAADPSTVDLTPFTGPVVFGSALQHIKYLLGANTGTAYDWYWESARPVVYNDYDSIGVCGLCDTQLRKDDGTPGQKYLWYDNGAAYGFHLAEGAARAYLRVDGTAAYFPGAAQNILLTGPSGIPAVTATATRNPVTGDVTLITDEQTTTCGAFPPTSMNCPTFSSANVAVKRTIVEDEGGFRVQITDEWRSTDGQPHAVDVDMDEYIQSNNNKTGLRFPGDADYGPKGAAGTTRTGFSGITTIAFKSDSTGPASVDAPAGSLTVLPAPSQALFSVASSGMILRHLIAVPATGVATVKRIYVSSATDAGLDAPTVRARDLIEGPTVTLDALPATVSSPALRITGAATDAIGVATVTVNGGAATLAGTAYGRDVTLTPGANPITVVATDGAGNTATTSGTVTYTPPPVATPPVTKPPVIMPPTAKKPTFSKSGKAFAKTVKGITTVTLGQKVTCPAGTTTCSTTISAKAGKTSAGSAKLSTKPGRSTVLKLKLGKAAAKTLKTKRKLTIKVTIVAKAGTGVATTTVTVTLRR